MSKSVGDNAVNSNLLRDTGQAALQSGVRFSIHKCSGECPFMLAMYKCALLGYFVHYLSEPEKMISHRILLGKLAAHGLDRYTLLWVRNWLEGHA